MDEALSRMPSVVVTDSKNVYDSVVRIETSGLQLEEKRLALEVLSIRERVLAAGVSCRWVDSDQQLADGLSKPFVMDSLLTSLQKGKLCLEFDQFVSAKRKRAWRREQHVKGPTLTPEVPAHQEEFCSGVECSKIDVPG